MNLKSKYIRFPLSGQSKKDAEGWLVTSGNISIIYFPWHAVVLEISDEARRCLIEEQQGKTYRDVIEDIRSELLENPVPLSRSREDEEFAPTLIGLGLTDACTLACVYCHSDASLGKHNLFMPFELAEKSLDYVVENAKRLQRKFEVNFTGPGEPTYPWDLFRRCTEYAENISENLSVELDISMATNGYYDYSKRQYIVDHFNGVSLSFDGMEDIQNLHRPSDDTGLSFATVYETARFFHDQWGHGKKNFTFAIRATVSQQSLDKLSDIHAFFRNEFPKARIGYEMLNPLGRGKSCNYGYVTCPSQPHFMQEVSRIMRSEKRDLVMNSGAGRLSELKRSFCKALAMPTMNVTPDGKVIACQRDGAPDYYQYGYYCWESHRFVFDFERIRLFRGLTVDCFPECSECIAKYHCAGDCNDLRRAGVRRCAANRQLLLSSLFSYIGGKASDVGAATCSGY